MADWGTARLPASPPFPVEMTAVIRCALGPPGPHGGGAHRISTRFRGRVTVRPPAAPRLPETESVLKEQKQKSSE